MPIACFSNNLAAAHSSKDGSSTDTDLHGPDSAARDHTEKPRSLTAKSLWALFGQDKPATEFKAGQGASSSEDEAVEAAGEAATGSDAAQTNDADTNVNAVQLASNGQEADEESTGSSHTPDASNVQEQQRNGSGATHAYEDNVASSLDETDDKENMDNVGPDRTDGKDDASGHGSKKDNDSDEDRQPDKLRVKEHMGSEQKGEESAFSSSQFWRTPLIVPDDIDTA